ncbi:MAG: nitroreductase family protein [Comamonadaceae bacterium]|nr:nitroreductase family protein [Comamonadaceae bacterium]
MPTGTEDPVQMASPADAAAWAAELIHSRRTQLPRRLAPPGPNASQQAEILRAAAAAPDHGGLLPWRFIVVPEAARPRLADAFAAALLARDAAASAEQLAQVREKAFRSPWLLLAVARLHEETGGAGPKVPPAERIVSAGCAIQNMLLMAHAQGFGAALTSGQSLNSAPLRTLFGLHDHEQALCFISVGATARPRPPRQRPCPVHYVTVLDADADAVRSHQKP